MKLPARFRLVSQENIWTKTAIRAFLVKGVYNEEARAIYACLL